MFTTRSVQTGSPLSFWLSYITIGRMTLAAGLLVILLGGVGRSDLTEVAHTVGVPLAALIGLSFIALSAYEVGIFGWLAQVVVRRSSNTPLQLFTIIYFTISCITILFPNDATILLLAPLIIRILSSLQHESWRGDSWLPFLYAIVFGANAASITFVTSNPINMIFASRFDLTYLEYARWMLLPGLASIIVCYGMLYLYFGKTLGATSFIKPGRRGSALSPDEKQPNAKQQNAKPQNVKLDPQYKPADAQPHKLGSSLLITLFVVLGVFAGYFILSALNIPYQYAILAGCLVILWPVYDTPTASLVRVVKGLPWDEILFVIGMFVLAFWVTHSRLSQLLPWLLEQVANRSFFETIFGTSLITALGVNLINDWPMATLSVIGLDALPPNLGSVQEQMIYTSVIGANLGNKILPSGSLATLIWMGIIYRISGIRVSWNQFIKVGLIVTPPTMLAAVFVLWLQFIW